MIKRWSLVAFLVVFLSLLAMPALAAQGGGVHFGPYTLSEGDSVTGDLVVFGPVNLKENSELRGDLVAFGELTVGENALVAGDLVAFGRADIAGRIEGDLFCAGDITLLDSAVVEGDVSAIGGVSQSETAKITGDIVPLDEADFNWNLPIVGTVTREIQPDRPQWLTLLWRWTRALLTVLALVLFALLIATVWPTQLQQVGRTLAEVPLLSFGMGLLILLGAGAVIVILMLTICLSPIALLAAVVVGIGVALGWVALGTVLGERILRGLFDDYGDSMIPATLLGTTIITLLAVLVNLISDCLYTVLIFPIFALAAGAVFLTRGGTQPHEFSPAVGNTSRVGSSPELPAELQQPRPDVESES